MKKSIIKVLSVLFAGLFLVTACSQSADKETKAETKAETKTETKTGEGAEETKK